MKDEQEVTDQTKMCPFRCYEDCRVLYMTTYQHRGILKQRWHVMCVCGACGPSASTPEEALREWDDRDPPRQASPATARTQEEDPSANGTMAGRL